MSVETLKAIFDWGTVVLIGLTFVFGAGALITGDKLNERQAKELLQLKQQNLELEKTLSPRYIWFKSIGGKTNIDVLKPFAGTNVVLEYLPNDEETRRAAGSIFAALQHSGWNIRATPNLAVEDGVIIVVKRFLLSHDPEHKYSEEETREFRNDKAASVLGDFLVANGWDRPENLPSDPPHIAPANTIKISVGFKKLFPPEAKEMIRRMREIEAEGLQQREKLQHDMEEIDRQRQEWQKQHQPQ